MSRVLVVDDDRAIRRTLENFLRGENFDAISVADGESALQAIQAETFDVVLLDLGLPGVDGLGLLELVNSMSTKPAVVVITARDDMQSVVRAVQLGAYDYLVKPLDIECLKLALTRAVESRRQESAGHEFSSRAHDSARLGEIVGRSEAMRQIYKTIGAVSTSKAAVLIRGESGTGKELVARAIHHASPTRDRPFVAVNCTALSPHILESELFGHVRGAFTGAIAEKIGRFELADEGTLFLDEIGDVSVDLQVKLLRVLQERTFERVGDSRPIPFRARIVAATHHQLSEKTRVGSFREDLLYRLSVIEIVLPPLRERCEDLPLLIESLLAKVNREVGKQVTYVEPAALSLLQQYTWPGNVRELENALTRAVVLAKSNVLEADLLPSSVRQPVLSGNVFDDSIPSSAIAPLRVIEKKHIARALAFTSWNKRRACALLEISRPTLDRKIEEYGLLRKAP